MKFRWTTRAVINSIASCCILLQGIPVIAGPPQAANSPVVVTPTDIKPASPKVPPPAAIDVALAPNGVASGRVLDAQQKGIANSVVSFRQGKEQIVATTTDEQGRFEVQNLRGGTYLITSNNGYGLFRFWAPKTAPPTAREQVLLRSQAVVVRAQSPEDSGEVFYDENGQPYARIHVVDDGSVGCTEKSCKPVGANLCCLCLFPLALLALAAGPLFIDHEDHHRPRSP